MFPELKENISPWVDSALRALSRINKNKSTPAHIIVQLQDFRGKDPLLPGSREPAENCSDNSPHLSDSPEAQETMEGNNCQPEFYTQSNYHS